MAEFKRAPRRTEHTATTPETAENVLPFRCMVQERLRAQFNRALDAYNAEWLAIFQLRGPQAATEELDAQYCDCVHARTELQLHEGKHGCLEEAKAIAACGMEDEA